jgi:hypothetical protein
MLASKTNDGYGGRVWDEKIILGSLGLTIESHEVEEIFTRLASRMRSYHKRNKECGLSVVAAIASSNSVIYDAGPFGRRFK